jgi:hypothetical protein
MRKIRDPFLASVNTYQQAVAQNNKALGLPAPEVEQYQQLKPQDFDDLTNRFGADDTLKYIQTMEKQMMGGK